MYLLTTDLEIPSSRPAPEKLLLSMTPSPTNEVEQRNSMFEALQSKVSQSYHQVKQILSTGHSESEMACLNALLIDFKDIDEGFRKDTPSPTNISKGPGR